MTAVPFWKVHSIRATQVFMQTQAEVAQGTVVLPRGSIRRLSKVQCLSLSFTYVFF